MRRLIPVLKTGLLSSLVFLLALFSPVAAYAADSTEEECVPPPATSAGVHRPVGADAAAYTYNCDSKTWVSDHYIFYPNTGNYEARDPEVYTYNDATGLWDCTVWSYNAPQKRYIPGTNSVQQPPAGAKKVGGPKPTVSSPVNNGSNTTNNSTSNSSNANAVANVINGVATSGASNVSQNTTAGNAMTGNATAVANIMNMMQSNTNAYGGGAVPVTFVSDINGDVNGDLILDPAQLSSLQSASNSGADYQNVVVNAESNNSIDNDVHLVAQTGNAGVSENTTAGNATSGNANAVANIVNIINSAITSGRSFIGVVNINGNLNGDILLPADFVDQLLASNVPTTMINTSQLLNGSSTTAQVNNTNINNSLTANASTGDASVDRNTSAGNATSGQASTNITAFNLTGSSVLGKNSILVFVNVMGNWVGMIVNAPAGTTAAQLGGGITANNQIPNSDINSTVNNSINNNVTVDAASGDATVTKNTTAGNAKSGDANAAINVLNVANSEMSFTDWLGILFINVFGSWNGSFGVNTSAGDPIASQNSSGGTPTEVRVFRFEPKPAVARVTTTSASSNRNYTVSNAQTDSEDQPQILGTTTESSNDDNTPIAGSTEQKGGSNWTKPFIMSGFVGLLFLGFEQLANLRRRVAHA